MRHFHVLTVLASATLFAFCLSQTAYDIPGYTMDGATDIASNSSLSNLGLGWMGLPVAAVTLFYPYPLVILIIVSAYSYRAGFSHFSFAIAGIASLAMIFTHTWALASWMANLLLLLSWIFLVRKNTRLAFYNSSASSLLALSFRSIGELPFGPKGGNVPIWSFREGYWLWILASATMALGSSALWWHERRQRPTLGAIQFGTKEET